MPPWAAEAKGTRMVPAKAMLKRLNYALRLKERRSKASRVGMPSGAIPTTKKSRGPGYRKSDLAHYPKTKASTVS